MPLDTGCMKPHLGQRSSCAVYAYPRHPYSVFHPLHPVFTHGCPRFWRCAPVINRHHRQPCIRFPPGNSNHRMPDHRLTVAGHRNSRFRRCDSQPKRCFSGKWCGRGCKPAFRSVITERIPQRYAIRDPQLHHSISHNSQNIPVKTAVSKVKANSCSILDIKNLRLKLTGSRVHKKRGKKQVAVSASVVFLQIDRAVLQIMTE